MGRLLASVLIVLGCGLAGLVLGWWVGNAMELTGIMDPETFWKTDPENVWAWAAIIGGLLGLIGGAGLVAVWQLRYSPKAR